MQSQSIPMNMRRAEAARYIRENSRHSLYSRYTCKVRVPWRRSTLSQSRKKISSLHPRRPRCLGEATPRQARPLHQRACRSWSLTHAGADLFERATKAAPRRKQGALGIVLREPRLAGPAAAFGRKWALRMWQPQLRISRQASAHATWR